MPINVCPDRGAWDVEKRIVPMERDWAVAICTACGAELPFLRLPPYIVSGPSGTRKSTEMNDLLHTLPGFVVLESDILWGTAAADGPNDYHSYYDLWLRMVKAVA